MADNSNYAAGLVDQSVWESNPEQAYQMSLGLPSTGMTPYQKWLRDQFGTVYTGWQINNAVPGGNPVANFADYFNTYGIPGARNQGTGIMSKLLTQAPQEQRTFFDTLGSDTTNDLLAMLSAQRYGQNPIASRMASSLSNQYQRSQAEQANNENYSFLSYLRSKYGF